MGGKLGTDWTRLEPGTKEWRAAGVPDPGTKEWTSLYLNSWAKLVEDYDVHGWPVSKQEAFLFSYKPEEWEAIRAAVPANMTEHWWRGRIEHDARTLVISSRLHPRWHSRTPRDRARKWRQVERLAADLEDRLRYVDLDYLAILHDQTRGSSPASFEDFLEDLQENLIRLADLAHWSASNVENRAKGRRKKSNATDRDRNAFLRSLLRVWQAAGGQLKVSSSDGRADGPLIRFLLAAARPALAATGRDITEEALKHFVRKARSGASSLSGLP